jgi:DNA-binding transcriptional regulator GbsR (MarR family)
LPTFCLVNLNKECCRGKVQAGLRFIELNLIIRFMDTYTLKLEAPWEEVKELLKEANTELTDEDLEYKPNEEKILLERLAKKMNKSEDYVKDWIESVSSNRGLAS